MKTGGLGAEKMSDPEVEEAVKNVKGILEEKTNTKYDSIEILSYKPQLVAGMNYFVKVSDVYFYLISLFKVYFCSDYYSNKILLFLFPPRPRLYLRMVSRKSCISESTGILVENTNSLNTSWIRLKARN